jgi:hypothetical protein
VRREGGSPGPGPVQLTLAKRALRSRDDEAFRLTGHTEAVALQLAAGRAGGAAGQPGLNTGVKGRSQRAQPGGGQRSQPLPQARTGGAWFRFAALLIRGFACCLQALLAAAR